MPDYDARTVLQDGMYFQGYTDERFPIHLDAAESVGGQDKGSRPFGLMLVSLAACMGMDVISILRKKRQDVTGFEVRVKGDQASEHPKVYTHIWVTFLVTGHNVDPAAVERAIELSYERYCPAAGMLKQVVPIETEYQITEA